MPDFTQSAILCPLDGRPCDPDCPDRYIDQPEGGCILTTTSELGCKVFILDEQGSLREV